jgi:DNA replication and repair protein RecF
VIALRLAQFDWLKAQKKTNPILLLDDIFDKLDGQRVQKLVALVTQDYFGQVMVSDTDEERMKALLNSLKVPSKLFKVMDGDVNEISS